MKETQVTLAVLAGGAGTRMGVAKSHLKIRGEPILRWLLGEWVWKGPTLLVTTPGREHPPGAPSFDREVVDAVADEGPLRGIVTALHASSTAITIIATCDMPLVRSEQLIWLAEQLVERPPATLGLFLGRRSEDRQRIEPFPCAIRTAALDLIERQLESEDRSVHGLTELPQFCLFAAPGDWPEKTWLNLNRTEDLKTLERMWN